MKFLLRPGWIAMILLVGVFSAVCFTVLAPWQFSRDAETQARNDAIRESMHASARPIRQVLPPGSEPTAATEWTKVSFGGHYLPAGETLAWQRTVLGEPAFEVLTPFRLDSVLFEAASAFGTTGLSTGITGDLPAAGQLVLVVLMFAGRLGPITFASALALRERGRRYDLPEERPIVG